MSLLVFPGEKSEKTTRKGNEEDMFVVIHTQTGKQGTTSKICHCSKYLLSYDAASGSEITPCNKIDKPLVVYRFTGNVIASITTLRT